VDSLRAAIKKLPAQSADPLTMSIDGYKYDEIAKELNIPVGTVKTRIHNAKKNIYFEISGDTNRKPRRKSTPVIQMTMDGTPVAEFDSIYAAAMATGTNLGGLAYAVRGDYKHSGGFIWKKKIV
jgi:hypothetical protein